MPACIRLQQKQICSFWKSPINQITFQMVNIQQQPNASDCGVFAIAVATEKVIQETVFCICHMPNDI